MSYDQKTRLINHIVATEADLGVQVSSWKHCLLFMLLNGTITEKQFRDQFNFTAAK